MKNNKEYSNSDMKTPKDIGNNFLDELLEKNNNDTIEDLEEESLIDDDLVNDQLDYDTYITNKVVEEIKRE